MKFKYSTRQFINEVQCRPCLWNNYMSEYSDRAAREMAWLEIGKIMYDDWEDVDPDDKTEKVKDMQKKWKGLRDYFTRESRASNNGLQYKRKRPFLEMLNFLKDKSKSKQAPANHPLTDTIRGKRTKKNSNTLLNDNQKYPRPTVAAATQPAKWESTELQLNDPDTNFLLSILPDIKSMNPSQNFEFRFQVMTLIGKIKYSQQNANYYEYCTPGSSNFTNQLPNFQSATPEEVDPISNEMEASSPEDQKIILHYSGNSSPS